jgi:hypothetical protein
MTNQGPISDADRELALGNTTPIPVPQREPDVLVDSLATDGTQPADRRNVHRQPTPGAGR